MSDDKKESDRNRNKSKGSKHRKSHEDKSSSDYIPKLRYGPNTNLHVWKQRIKTRGKQTFKYLLRLLDEDKYYVPKLLMPIKDADSYDNSSVSGASEESKNDGVVNTRSRTQRSVHPSGELTPEDFPEDIRGMSESLRSAYASEMMRTRAKIEAKMYDDRPAFYGFMEEHMSRESLDAVKKDPEYPIFSANDDPLGLWLAIKRTHKIGSDSGVGVIKKSDARLRYANAKQGTYESITAYKDRFDHLLDAYDISGNKTLDDEDIATDYLRSLDDARYRELKLNVENDELMGYNKIPKTLSDMHALACNFKVLKKNSVTNHGTSFATHGDSGRGGRRGSRDSSQGRSKNSKSSADSDDDEKSTSKPGRRQLICFGCREPGHKVADCPNAEKQAKKDSDSKVYCTQSAVGYTFASFERCAEWYEVLIDNQSDVSVIDERLLSNVHESDQPRHISGMGPTPLTLTRVGHLDGFFDCVAGRDLKANLLCQAHVEDKFPMTWKQGKSLTVHLPDRDLVFERRGDRYVGDMRDWIQSDHYAMVTTAAENASVYTKAQVARAEAVRDLLRNFGYPSQSEAVKLITDGNVARIPYTVQDVKRCYDIYGPPAEFVRGKKTAKKVSRQEMDVSIKDEHCKPQKMYGDIVYVKKKMFVITLSEPLGLILVTPVANTMSESLGYALQEQVNTLRSGGFAPRIAYLDNQPGFAALVGNIPGVEIDIAGTGDHMDKIDAKIRRMKEMIRSVYSGLPWKLPNLMVRDLVKYCVSRMNLKKSSSNGALESPRVAFTGRRPDFTKELGVGFGDYCEVHRPNVVNNDVTAARTVPCIALRPAGNATGSWWMMNLRTCQRLRTTNWKKMVTTSVIVKDMNAICDNESERGYVELFDEDFDAKSDIQSDVNPVRDPYVPVPRPRTTQEDTPELIVESESPSVKADEVEVEEVDSGSDVEVDGDEMPDPATRVTDGEKTEEKLEHEVYVTNGTAKATPYFCMMNMSVRKGLQEHGQDAYAAIMGELKQLVLDKKALHAVPRSEIPRERSKQVIRSHMFLKSKFDALGRFEKIKARLVANGAQQDRKLYEDVSSPTAKVESVMMVLATAAYQKRVLTAVDIGGAYLNADISGEDILMELDPLLTNFMLKIKPDYKPCVGSNGKLTVRLDKALYGCIQSAKLWYETLTKYLRGKGFEHNEVDNCVMNRLDGNRMLTIVIFVDDILISADSMSLVNKFVGELKTEYREIKVSEPDNFSYLGMHIFKQESEVRVSMKSFEVGVVKENMVSGSVTSPATGDLFKFDNSSELAAKDAKKFHTNVAKLLYLAKRVRPDILLSVAYLSTKVKAPTEGDLKKLNRLLKYLNGTVGRELILSPSNGLSVVGYVDAAFGLHNDGKSHTGMVITVGGATVMCKSGKQKMVTRDSTEAELVGLSDRIMDVLQCDEFMKSQGVCTDKCVIMQDNDSTITLVKSGRGKYRTKHLKVRQAHVKELIDSGAIGVEYLSTKLMLADPLSKPLQGALFRHLTSSTFGEKRLTPQGRVDDCVITDKP